MKKRLKLRLTDIYEVPVSDIPREALGDFLRKYKKEFPFIKVFANHCYADINVPYSVYIYAENSNIRLRPVGAINIQMDDKFFDHFSIFHDYPMSFRGLEYVNTFKIRINGHFVGHYLYEYKVLLLTDFTHKVGYIDYAYQALLAIVRVLGIDTNWSLPKSKKKKEKVKVNITLGCDPEFMLKKRTWIRARDFYDTLENEIGCDGAGTQLELRPSPHSNPAIVIRNIKKLLRKVKNDGFDIQIADEAPLGGHIHVGFKFNGRSKAIRPSDELLTAYDDFLGKRTNKLCYREGYGYLSSYETKDWGFEYRTPSAAIFAHPEIARISMKIIKNLTKLAVMKKEIQYNRLPTEEDYIKIAGLSKKEAATFLAFVNEPPKPPYSILEFWKIKPPKGEKRRVTYPLEVRFGDEWMDGVARKVIKWANSLRLKKPVRMILFGLKESRGKVTSGIKVRGYKLIEHEYTKNDKAKVGIAWHLRQGIDDIEKIFKPLRRYIKENLGG
ncbi:hypothetical protein J7J62_03955 [bacterium]|nr:hypothetical protein [bacterium]